MGGDTAWWEETLPGERIHCLVRGDTASISVATGNLLELQSLLRIREPGLSAVP